MPRFNYNFYFFFLAATFLEAVFLDATFLVAGFLSATFWFQLSCDYHRDG